jgi:hypothetical protein
MQRRLFTLTAAAAVAAMTLAASEASAARRAHGARFHGAEFYLPGYSYAGFNAPPIFNDGSAYCWHWFRAGRGWATTWSC